METEVVSGSKGSCGIPESSEAVMEAAEGAETSPTTQMEMVEEATTFMSKLPATLMLEVVGAVVSARFEVIGSIT